jgi:hypothetical protein
MKSPAISRVRKSRHLCGTLHRTRSGSIHVADKDLWAFRSRSQELFCNVLPPQEPQFSPGLKFTLLVRSKIPNVAAWNLGEMREQADSQLHT